jgi:hypothetical protein
LKAQLEQTRRELERARDEAEAARQEALKQRDQARRAEQKARAQAEAARAQAEAALRQAEAERARAQAEAEKAQAEAERAARAAAQRAEAERAARVAALQAEARARSLNHLKQIGVALHNYHAIHNHLPPAALLDKEGKPLLSWRVILLPYMEKDELYKQFKIDEPWDSAHNKKLIAQMPKVFAPGGDGKTHYRVFTGKGTAFEGTKGLRFSDFTDGLSNTAVVVEAGEAVPWTKPDELPYAADKPLPKLGAAGDGFGLLFGDGDARSVKKKFDEKIMRRIITRNDGEAVNVQDLDR